MFRSPLNRSRFNDATSFVSDTLICRLENTGVDVATLPTSKTPLLNLENNKKRCLGILERLTYQALLEARAVRPDQLVRAWLPIDICGDAVNVVLLIKEEPGIFFGGEGDGVFVERLTLFFVHG